jgi:bacterioferritin-associated ferredoxin
MFVCLCKGINDRTIRGLVRSGHTTLKDVMRKCQAGTDCGACVCTIRELIDAAGADSEAEVGDCYPAAAGSDR